MKKILTTLMPTTRIKSVLDKNIRFIAAVAIAFFVTGVILSHRVEPGVRVKTVTLAGDTPALKFIPAGSGPHPVALLAHGYSATKENLFWYAEALSAAGFICYSVDLPGHGESRRLYSFVEAAHTLGDLALAIGPVDVFVGHSMGGGAGGEAVREGFMRPKLVIAVGSAPRLGEQAPPLLLLVGRFDEFFKSAELKTRTDAQLLISPWSNHGLELFDPLLVNAATTAACRAVGKTPPPALTSWRWRVAGTALTMVGALGLALILPIFPPRWTWARGVVVSALFITAFVLSINTCLNVKPHLRNMPLQIAVAAITLALLVGARKLQIRRWVFAAFAGALAICCGISSGYVIANGTIFMVRLWLFCQVLAPALLLGTIVGAIAAFRGSRFGGDVAVAVIVGCGLFPLGNAPRTALEPAKPHVFMKLDAKL